MKATNIDKVRDLASNNILLMLDGEALEIQVVVRIGPLAAQQLILGVYRTSILGKRVLATAYQKGIYIMRLFVQELSRRRMKEVRSSFPIHTAISASVPESKTGTGS